MSTATTAPYSFTRVGGYVKSREHDGFDAFVRARLPELLRFGRALTGSEEAGADLVQDALERTLLHWRRVESQQDPEGYVRRIMVNRNISLWRKFGRERPTDRVPEQSSMAAEPDDGATWAAVQQLPPRQRAVIALRYYEDLSEAQIAAVLGCSVGTVKSQSSKAMRTLRRLIPAERGGVS
jgi:RNA polymerase sigma-70 factor (sigma-E family)